MESITALGLAFLEMIFVFVTLMLLHGLRKLIGSASFYISTGLLLVFTHIIATAGIEVKMDFWGGSFQVSSIALFMPCLAAMLVIYVCEGTLATQRLIVGIIACLGFYTYLSVITKAQCNWYGFAITKGPTADTIEFLLLSSQRSMAGTTLSMILDLFLLPIFFQRLRNIGCRLFFCCLGALALTQLADAFLYASITSWGSGEWINYITAALTVRTLAVIVLSLLATVYLSRIERERPGEGRGALDIVFAFFGGYGRAQALQMHINEWEDRYRMVVENATEMILLLTRDGRIIDANFAACRIMRIPDKSGITGKYFPSIFYDLDNKPLMWNENYMSFDDDHSGTMSKNIDCYALAHSDEKIELSLTISEIDFEKVKMFIVVGRDVTEQNRLAREKEDLTMQLAHAQRLESVGQLAGGVAHDFNNYIHSIIGHLDVVKYIHKVKDEQIVRHIDKAIDISEQAARLTQQLLGFARKGKYVRKELEVADLVAKSIELFVPGGQENIEIRKNIPKHRIIVCGDIVQLQQVMLNLLINARDAMTATGHEQCIDIIVCEAADKGLKLQIPQEMRKKQDFDPSGFCRITVRDNGEGIDKQTMERIFEPFFTTKAPGKGTGMGLSMVYGTIVNHGGWVQVESEPGTGTAFHLILPRHKAQE